MNAFQKAYAQLNDAQRLAVDTIEGPVLVIAGPGTGKTQLLSARVANILEQSDTPAQNILCLTFTESGAANMRERLTSFIGTTAYDVTIGTYHAFGADLIQRYPEYFTATRLQNPIDELGKRQVLIDITEKMSYTNPLKQTRHHLGDLMSTISEVKRALLSPEELRAIASQNLHFITAVSRDLQQIFETFSSMPRSTAKALPYFEQTFAALTAYSAPESLDHPYGDLSSLAAIELSTAIDLAEKSGKTRSLTEWKNTWLEKDSDNTFIFSGELENKRVRALASVLEQYHSALEEQGLYDFDDMILRSITALQKNPNLRYTLQEKYLYILLDEFQDTNAAQLQLIQLLTDSPVNEGRPNIMAVGDDDQAIYAFQGAQYSNMLDFFHMYRDVQVVNLTENYRSHQDIIDTARNIAGQISSRLHENFENIDKKLIAANPEISDPTIERVDFLSAIAERDWTAKRIKQLIDQGIPAGDIAVLAPKHKYLEPLVPYLNTLNIPVRYEKRENILEAPVVRQLIIMSRLAIALQSNDHALANHLWPEVLSFEFWKVPTHKIWQTAWKVSDAKDNSYSWSKVLLEDADFRLAASVMLGVAGKVHTESAEMLLDILTGTTPLETHDPLLPLATSPLKEYYTSADKQLEHPDIFYETISHLTVIRSRLREHQKSLDATLSLPEFLKFIAEYEEAEQQMINTSPYSQHADAVQLMTVFKAKGLEYKHVFLPSCQDEVWGSSSRDNGNKLTLPPNLQPIRHAGASDDERLRILYVAMTRARHGLHLTSSTQNYNGKPTKRLKYFDEREQEDSSYLAKALPEHFEKVTIEDTVAPELRLLEIDWRARHFHGLQEGNLAALLSERLRQYQLSPTHIIDFMNLEYGGPEKFFLKTLLKFPEAPLPDAEFGTAIHETLEWLQHQTNDTGLRPTTSHTIDYFVRLMATKKLPKQRVALEIERGEKALNIWLRERSHIIQPGGITEKSFHNEGVFIDDAHMSGRVDRLEIDPTNRTITVVDYKTGKAYDSWRSELKLLRYRLQLYCYKLLIEGSRSYRNYKVTSGRIEFIEPDEKGKVHSLVLRYDEDELVKTRQLIGAIWEHIHALTFPDISTYPSTVAGLRAFEQDMNERKYLI